MKNSHQIRMCISCRGRYPKNSLIRLKDDNGKIIAYNSTGRSFYICKECSINPKKIKGLVKRFKLEVESFTKLLEILQ
jgi:predicted RNA-binding protein YlxR (DUF448 family)